MPKPKGDKDKVKVEPGADKRLANILKKALNTPPQHRGKEAPGTGSANAPPSKSVQKRKARARRKK